MPSSVQCDELELSLMIRVQQLECSSDLHSEAIRVPAEPRCNNSANLGHSLASETSKHCQHRTSHENVIQVSDFLLFSQKLQLALKVGRE